MANLGTLTLDLVAKTGGFTEGLSKAERQIKRLEDVTKKKTATDRDSANATQSQLRNLDLLGKLARQAGLDIGFSDRAVSSATRAFSGMSVVTAALGVGLIGLVGGAIGGFISAIGKTSKETEEAKKELQGLSLAYVNLGKSVTQAGADLERFQRGSLAFIGIGNTGGRLDPAALSGDELKILARIRERVFQAQEQNRLQPGGTAGAAFNLLGVTPEANGQLARTSDILGSIIDNIKSLRSKPGGTGALFQLFGPDTQKFLEDLENNGQISRAIKELRLSRFKGGDEPFLPKDFKFFPEIVKEGEKAATDAKKAWENYADSIYKEHKRVEAEEKGLGNLRQEKADELQKSRQEALRLYQSSAQEIRTLEISQLPPLEQVNAQFDERRKKLIALSISHTSSKEEIDALIQANEKLRAVALLSADPERNRLMQEGLALTQSLRTDTEKYADEIGRLTLLLFGGAIGFETFARAAAGVGFKDVPKAALGGFEDAPKLDGEHGDLDRLDELANHEQALNKWYETQMDLVNGFRAEKLGSEEAWDAKEEALAKKHADSIANIELERTKLVLSVSSNLFGDLAEITKTFQGETAASYRALFALSKAFAIAEATIKVYQAIANASVSAPFPANLISMATIASATASLVSQIESVGLAHEGMDFIPKSGSWMLEKGERVTTEKTSKRLDRTLDRIQQEQRGGGVGGALNVNIHEAPGTTAQVTKRDDGGLDVRIALIEERLLERMNRGAGLAGPFDRRYGRKY